MILAYWKNATAMIIWCFTFFNVLTGIRFTTILMYHNIQSFIRYLCFFFLIISTPLDISDSVGPVDAICKNTLDLRPWPFMYLWAKDSPVTGTPYTNHLLCFLYVVLVVPRSGGQDSALEKNTMVCCRPPPRNLYGTSALCTGTFSFYYIYSFWIIWIQFYFFWAMYYSTTSWSLFYGFFMFVSTTQVPIIRFRKPKQL